MFSLTNSYLPLSTKPFSALAKVLEFDAVLYIAPATGAPDLNALTGA